MPGANYMGGKRNVVKAKVKDKTGRVQSDFFGRQRLNFYSKGLLGSALRKDSTKTMTGLTDSSGRTKFMFAHAKHQANNCVLSPLTSDSGLSKSKPSIFQTPLSKTSRVIANVSSSGSRSSKVLEALETSDPTLLRGAISRVLKMPDLACISNLKRKLIMEDHPPAKGNGQEHNTQNIYNPKQNNALHTCGEDSEDWISSIGTFSSGISPVNSPDRAYNFDNLPPSSPQYSYRGTSGQYYHDKLVSRKSPEIFEGSLVRDMSGDGVTTPNFPNPYFAGYDDTYNTILSFSSDLDFRNFPVEKPNMDFCYFASPTVFDPRRSTQEDLSSGFDRTCLDVSSSTLYSENASMPGGCVLNSTNTFHGVFEDDDPWNAIGRILGLPLNLDSSVADIRQDSQYLFDRYLSENLDRNGDERRIYSEDSTGWSDFYDDVILKSQCNGSQMVTRGRPGSAGAELFADLEADGRDSSRYVSDHFVDDEDRTANAQRGVSVTSSLSNQQDTLEDTNIPPVVGSKSSPSSVINIRTSNDIAVGVEPNASTIQLLEVDIVYQGPCLFSDDSDDSDNS